MNTREASNEGLVPWPASGELSEKHEALKRARQASPSAGQAEILRHALASEDDAGMVSSLMCAVMRHENCENDDEKGRHYPTSDIRRVYEAALAAATRTEVRIALHSGYATFRPVDSKDGLVEAAAADLLKSKLAAAKDASEQRALISLLRTRAGWSYEQLIDVCNKWLDDPKRSLTEDDLEMWASAVARLKEREPYRADRITQEAAVRLRRTMSRLDDSAVRSRAVRLLADPLYDGECFNDLVAAMSDPDPAIRREALRAAKKLGDRGKSEARRILVSDAEEGILSAAWDALQTAGDDPAAILLDLARNPELDAATSVACSRALHSDDISLLRRAWTALPAPFRSEMERKWRHDGGWIERRFHHPMWWELWHDLLRRDRPDSVAAAAAISWVTRPLHDVLGVYDFDTITGLRRDDPVEIRTERVFRFGFLADAEAGDGVPLREVLTRSRDIDLDELAELEVRYDEERDDVARLGRQINEIATQLSDEVLAVVRRWTLLHERPRFEPLRERLGPDGERLALLLKEHDRRRQQLAGSQGEGPFRRLHQASRYLAEFLPSVGCRFAGLVAPDGVLGEYNCEDRLVTLFSPMIELAASDVARSLYLPVDEIAPHVRTIVELHELAHAHVHLGRDASLGVWRQPEGATAAFHEALAQSYTRRVVAAMSDPHLREVLDAMETWLPPEYRFADLLNEVDAEGLRSWFVSRRHVQPARTLDDLVVAVLKAVPGYLQIVESTLGRQALSAIVSRLRAALKAAIDANSQERPVALHAVLSALAEQPNAAAILGAFLVGGWPADDERRWLLHEARISGSPVGKRPLRFIRKRDRVMAISQSRTASELGLVAALRACEIVALDERRPVSSAPQPESGRNRPRRRGKEAAT